MKWTTEAKVGAFSLLGIILFTAIIIQLSNMVIFGKSGFHVTGYFKEAEGIEPGNPVHYAGVEVGMVDKISVENGEAVVNLKFYNDAKVPKDADFSIQTSSVMGGRFIKVSGVIRKAVIFLMACPCRGKQFRGLIRLWIKWIN